MVDAGKREVMVDEPWKWVQEARWEATIHAKSTARTAILKDLVLVLDRTVAPVNVHVDDGACQSRNKCGKMCTKTEADPTARLPKGGAHRQNVF